MRLWSSKSRLWGQTAILFFCGVSAGAVAVIFAAGLATAEAKAPAAPKKSLQEQAAQFENRLCGVNPNRTLFRNQKREEVVLFFQNHLPRNRTPLLEVSAEMKGRLKTKSSRIAEVKSFVDANFSYVRSLDEVAASIGDRFIAKKLNWLGLEPASDDIGLEEEQAIFKAATDFETQLKKDNVSAKDLKSYLLLQLGPVLYSRWRNEGLRRTTRLVSLDDFAMRTKTRAYADSMESKATELLRAVPGSGLRTSDMERIIDSSQVALFSGVKDRSPEYVQLVAKIKKPEIKKLVEAYAQWVDQGVDSFSQRDEAAAKTILAQSGMGLILLSANFGPGVSDRLMDACTNPPARK